MRTGVGKLLLRIDSFMLRGDLGRGARKLRIHFDKDIR